MWKERDVRPLGRQGAASRESRAHTPTTVGPMPRLCPIKVQSASVRSTQSQREKYGARVVCGSLLYSKFARKISPMHLVLVGHTGRETHFIVFLAWLDGN